MSNQKTSMPKPVKIGYRPLVMCDSIAVDRPGWTELFDYGIKTGEMINQHGQSKDPTLLREILKRGRFERDEWLAMSPPEYAGAAKQCLNIEGHLFHLGYDKHVIKAAQEETDRFIDLSAPNWKEQLGDHRARNREAMSKLPSCACCGKFIPGKRQFCGQCKVVVYCGVDCQKEHWGKVHRDQCGLPGCGFCGRIPEKPMKCGKCLQVTYCDKECQTRDWKFSHKKECKAKE